MITARETRQSEGPGSRRSPLASGSISEHLLRGVAGLIAAVLAIALLARVGPASLVLLPITALAWRGCPTCWTVGLFGTLADGRARRSYCTAEHGCCQARRGASFQLED
ncbi:MAG TPA: hypothetical protein VGF81_04125 [Solirubrobacteraceae bacterium]|jgi:hypothetical protein